MTGDTQVFLKTAGVMVSWAPGRDVPPVMSLSSVAMASLPRPRQCLMESAVKPVCLVPSFKCQDSQCVDLPLCPLLLDPACLLVMSPERDGGGKEKSLETPLPLICQEYPFRPCLL